MNEKAWSVRVWGVRGSVPVPGAGCLEYGGHTSCVSVDCGDVLVALDAGSGLAELGAYMLREKRRRIDILLSHLHLDHIMGLFTFPPLHHRAFEIHLYGTPDMVRALPGLIGPPLWPVGLSDCRATVRLHEFLPGRPFQPGAGSPRVVPLRGSHPGGCAYFRLEGTERSLVYALDCELEGDMAPRLADFARGTDLLIWDASFTPQDLKPGWGHSTWEQGAALGREAGAKQVLMSHYSPDYTDAFLHKQEQAASRYGTLCRFAREGMVIAL